MDGLNGIETLFDRLGLKSFYGRVCDVCLLCVTDTLVRFHLDPVRGLENSGNERRDLVLQRRRLVPTSEMNLRV